MSDADDLRTAMRRRGIYESDIDWLFSVLADPVRRLAILSLVGEVREGWVDKPMAEDAHGYIDVVIRPTLDPDHYERVFVVRPRGESEPDIQADDPNYRPAPQMGHVERPRGEATG